MDHSHSSSSSSSSMSEASMSSSEHEPFDYEIDEPDDDDPHDDYEDVPDDEEDEEDDDEMDDDDDDDPHPIIIGPDLPSLLVTGLRADIADPLEEPHRYSERTFGRASSDRAFMTLNMSGVAVPRPPDRMPIFRSRRMALTRADDAHSLRNVVLQTFGALGENQPPRMSSSDSVVRNSLLLSDPSSRLRSRNGFMYSTRLVRDSDGETAMPSSVHPMLRRPSVPPSGDRNDAAAAAAAAIMPFVQVSGSALPQPLVESLGLAPEALRRRGSVGGADIGERIHDAFRRIRRAVDAIDEGQVLEDESSREEGTDSEAAVGESDAPRQPPSEPLAEAPVQPTAAVIPQEHGTDEILPSARPSRSEVEEGRSGAGRQAQLEHFGPPRGSRRGNESLPDSAAIMDLAAQDLMRSVEPVFIDFSGGMGTDSSPRGGSGYDRWGSRYRDREKVPSGVSKRWTYDPPSCGGDLLPAIFDNNFVQKSGRQHGNLHPSQPNIALDTHKSVDELATKVISRLDALMSDLGKIDRRVADEEAKDKARIAEEEKNKEAEKQEGEVKKVDLADENAAVEVDGSANHVAPSSQNASVEPVAAASTEQTVEMGSGMAPSIGAENLADEVAGELGEVAMQADPSPEANSDTVMDTMEDGVMENEVTAQREEGAVAETSGPIGSIEAPAVEPESAPHEPPVDASDFAAVAARRAAAAGISLDAPANEAPEIVAAATQSTGIDPAFLAALPNDMRAEILTQYYERTNAGGQAGNAPSASSTAVNQDFLVALPPALRGEVLELEAEFQLRHQATANNAGTGTGSGSEQPGVGGAVVGAEMDNATFLATLAPELREEILLTSAEAFIQSLPPPLAAEARGLREREAGSRFPWQVSAEIGEGRAVGNGVRARIGYPGRHGSRSPPKKVAVFAWKKVEDGWLREGPKSSNEPAPTLKEDGLSSLMQLVWLKQGHHVKSLVQQVFSHACKSTASRLVLLERLIELITSTSSAQSSFGVDKKSAPSVDMDRSRNHGTAVRRALELLTSLCKNDDVVAETMLGLPQTNEELAGIPKTLTADSVIPRRNCDISLPNLVSLLDTSLFVRSTAHLEQLVGLINILCTALPPPFANRSGRKTENGLSRRQRRHRESVVMARELSDMGILDDVDDEDAPHLIRIPHRHDTGADDDSEDNPFDIDTMHQVLERNQSRTRAQEPAPSAESKDAEKDVAIPVQYRIPGFSQKELVALTGVLLREGCSEKTFGKVSTSIAVLGEPLPLRSIFVESLVSIAISSGREIHVVYEQFIESLDGASKSKSPESRQECIESFASASGNNELTLLRVVKCLAALWDGESSDDKKKKNGDAEDPESGPGAKGADEIDAKSEKPKASTALRFRPLMLDGLRNLWFALDRLLGLVPDEAGMKEKKPKVEPKRSALPAAHVLNIDRTRSAHRSISPVLARLSPMIEAFLVVHSVEEKEARSAADTWTASENLPQSEKEYMPVSPEPMSPRAMVDADFAGKGLEGQLALFVERHRGPINALLRANPSLLDSSFKGALRHPHAIDFDNKKAYFRNVLKKRSSEAHAHTIRINVRRDRVFDDSYNQLRKRTPDEMKGRLHVHFSGEEGVDAGGVTREWYIILARQIFNPNYVLFCRSEAKAATYQPDKRSYITHEHLENFRFVGRIIGKAIYDGQLLDAYFTRSFYKHILGLKPTYHDIEAQDPDYYKSLKWMLENDITGVFDYTMSAEYDEFGKQTVIDLMPNGRNIPVTEENKADYVRLVTEVRMTKAIEKQIEAFKAGFHELIPLDDCKIFNELELELLMSGLPDIDVADLKANVEYTGYTAASPQVNWFWRCVGKMNQEDVARLVMFVTGTSKVPLEGFGSLQGMNGLQKFQIHRVSGDSMRLPSAHTCFNQLDLPEYSSAEVLSERLLRAVRECSVGFGFA